MTHNPWELKLLENKVEEEKAKIEFVKNKYKHLNTEEIYRDELVKLKSDPEEIRILLSLDKKIEWLDYVKYTQKYLYKKECDKNITEYLNNTSYYENDILLDSCWIEELKAMPYYSGWYYNESIYYYFFQEISPENHFSYLFLVSNLLQCFGYLVLLWILTYFIRILLFYIILWRAFPPK